MAEELQQENDTPLDYLSGQQLPPQTGLIIKIGAAIVGLILLFVFLSFLRSIYTDLLWFDQLGFRGVYVKVLVTRVLLFIIGAALFGALFAPGLYFAYRLSTGPVVQPLPSEAVAFLRKLIVWGGVVAVILFSVIFGAILASHWETFLRFTNAVSFGQTDPVFNKDISFYMFKLPVYTFLQGWLLGVAIVVLIGTMAMYFVNYSLRGVAFDISTGLKVHVSLIAAAIMLVLGWGHWLDRWELLLSGNGAVFGAAYADINARKPALLVLTIIAVASGVLMVGNAYVQGLRLMIGAAVLWVVMAILLGAVWPALMQQFTVSPNEFAKEAPYVARNLEFTRAGFALDRVEDVFYPAEPSGVTAELIRDNPQTVNNIRLWDPRPLSDVYRQIQLIRPYYDFKEADVDRYTIGGEYRQVLLSAREVAFEKLPTDSQTWVNQRLVYTHGIGVAMSPATDFTSEGRPEFFAKDIPTDGVIPITADPSADSPDVLVSNPRIYYGENTSGYVLVNTETDELDYQTEEGDLFRTKYFGEGGVSIGSFIRRVAYAWQFADVNILISGEISGDSRIQYRRLIQERIAQVAPFLRLDQDPYIVAAEGKLFWVQDAYTTSDRYPYSDPISDPLEESFNYMRNSIKVTVDAFDGTVTLYLWDTTDPIALTYQKIFPDLFLPKEAMPAGLQEHVRYPQDFFTYQARKYSKYHMRDPQNFYNNEDLWAFANEKFGQTADLRVVEPYYVIMKLPGEEREEFVQLLPYTPSQRQNLIGWLAARSDGDNYGRLVSFSFPKDRQVDGPEQVEARIDNDQDISAWFTLRCTEGSFCIRGNLLVIPLGDSIMYAEPVYLQAEGVSFPELKRVILATGEKVVMENSLSEALASLTGDVTLAVRPSEDGEVEEGDESVTPSAGLGDLQSEFNVVVETIEDLKKSLTALEEALERLKTLTGGE